MILGPDGKPVAVEPIADAPKTNGYEERLVMGAFLRAREAEIDGMYAAARKAMSSGPIRPPAPLTRRQRLGLAWWRLRRSAARAVLRVAELISPGVAGEDCDC